MIVYIVASVLCRRTRKKFPNGIDLVGCGISGYYVSLLFTTARNFTRFERFRCEITAEGDTEAIIFLSRENALSRAEDLRIAIKARKRPMLSIAQRNRKAVRVLYVRPTSDHLVGLTA